jgi:hypothetical protein
VLNDLGDVGTVTGANFTKDTLGNPDYTTDDPVTPENTNSVVRTVRRPIRLEHTEHSVELPVDEEDDEQVVGVPELFKVLSSLVLTSVPSHRSKRHPHKPTSDGWTRLNTNEQEVNHSLPSGSRRVNGNPYDIDDMGECVDKRPDNNGPSYCLMEGDVLVERNDCTNWGTTHERDEVSADWKENEDYIDVTQHCGGTSDSESGSKLVSGVIQVVFESIVGETKSSNKYMKEDEDRKEYSVATFIDHPKLPSFSKTESTSLNGAFDTAIGVSPL